MHSLLRMRARAAKLRRMLVGRITVRRSLRRMMAAEQESLRRIAVALVDTVEHRCSGDEEGWIERIEAARAHMLRSDERLTIKDYGAGAPGSLRSAEEMRRGVDVVGTVRQFCAASKAPEWGLVLLKLIRALRPEHCLELGTCVGISAAYQSAALEMNDRGHLVTLEGASALAHLAEANLQELGLMGRCKVLVGPFCDTLPQVLDATPGLDYAFIDGHHDGDATKLYFLQLLPSLSEGALVVFDDTDYSTGMRQAWADIASDPHVMAAIDLSGVGLCLVSKSHVAGRRRFSVVLPF